MFTKKTAGAIILGLFVTAAFASAQMGTGRVTGTIKNTQGKPVEGVKITATTAGNDRELETTTDKDGKWALLGFRSGTYEFTFTAPGYKPQGYTNAVKQMGRNPSMDIVLEPLEAGQSGGGAVGAALDEANKFFDAKQYPEALAKYEEILVDQPTLYQVNYNIGSVYRQMGDLDKAREYYEKVLAEEPMNTAALVGIGDLLVDQGKLEESVPYFEKAIGQTTDEVVPFNVGEIYMSEGNAAKAIEYYKIAAERKPDWPEAHLKLAYAYLNTGDMAAARGAFEKVVEVAPDTPQAQMAQQALAALPQ